MIRLRTDTRRVIGELLYRDRARDGTVGVKRVPIMVFDADGLPPAVDAVMMTADLQGSAGTDADPVLPLEALVPALDNHARNGEIPALDRTVAVLAGDFWARLDASKRGGEGDIRGAVRAVREAFLGVALIAGNHDWFGDHPSDLTAFGREHEIALASDRLVDVHGVRIAGVDGVVGDPARRSFRRPLAKFVAAVDQAARHRPDIVLLHQGPARGTDRRPEVPEIRAACLKFHGGLVVFGHTYEVYGDPNHPFAREYCMLDVRDDLQFVNATERVILAIRPEKGSPQMMDHPYGLVVDMGAL